MGKTDKNKARGAANEARDLGRANTTQGIQETGKRSSSLVGRSDGERAALDQKYTGFGNSTNQQYLNELGSARATSTGGGGGGGSPRASSSNPKGVEGVKEGDYVGVWNELMKATGGFDTGRAANIKDISGKLAGAEGNYGASKEAISGLTDFAKRGGITDDDRSNINRDYLLETERTGGYNPGDVENIRSRSNSAAPAMYQNMQDSMERSRGVNNFGPGFDRAGFKMMRQGAQDQGTAARDTEIGISDAIRSGRLDASKFLSTQGLNTADLTSRNQLSGYKAAGDMDISRNSSIEDAIAKSAGLDLDTQGLINQTRLGASTSKGQDSRARDAIGAASGAAAAARADANSRWASQMSQQDRMFGASGLSDTYSRAPTELMFNQNLLRDYRNDYNNVNQNNVNNQIGAGMMPGSGTGLKQGISNAQGIMSLAYGGMGGGMNLMQQARTM